MNHELDNDTHDLDWMAGQQPQRISAEPFVAGDPFARERAMQALVRHIDSDGARGDSRLRRLLRQRTLVLATATGAAALLAVAILTSGGGDTNAGGTHAGDGHVGGAAKVAAGGGAHQPLMRLADYVSKSPEPTGNATLVQRTTTLGGKKATVYDLYADDGRYFFAESKGELAGAIEAGKNTAGGWTARELAAAEEADSGDLAAAAEDMASAAIPKERFRPGTRNYPNRLWEESEQTLIAGAGQPQIRAGVLKMLGTLPGVAVTEGALSGRRPWCSPPGRKRWAPATKSS